MIKNLLNADEEPPPGTKVVIEDSIADQTAETKTEDAAQKSVKISENAETPPAFEIPEDAQFFTKTVEPAGETPQTVEPSGLPPETIAETVEPEKTIPAEESQIENPPANIEPPDDRKSKYETSGTLFQSEAKPQSAAETIRQSGLAWSAGIVLFSSVIFMMIFGWFADLLLGSSPWGILGGIILGGIIGFIQFFRITSQIFKK